MAWGRIDDTWYRHRKTLALDPVLRGDTAFLFWASISWSNDQLADGVVTMATVRMLGCDRPIADELVRVGFFEHPSNDVYLVHDYAVYNKLRAQVLAERAADAARQASHRESQRDRTRDGWRDTERDKARDTGPLSIARPVSRIPVPENPNPEDSPPPPARRGRRSNGTNLRAVGDNPRATGDAPRQNGTSPRQERDAEKRGPTRLADILAETQRRAGAVAVAVNGKGLHQATLDEVLG